MLSRFLPWWLATTFARGAKKRQETPMASPLVSLPPPDVGP